MRRSAQLRLRRALLSALFVGSAFPLAGPVTAVCAAPGSAALVVDTGEAATTYCVALSSSSVSGIELIQLAGEQHGLQYSLGYGGGAVCQLEGVGPDGQDCFADHPNFWGYWRGDGSGGWAWSGTGAGSTSVEAGDVEGWSWGSGQDGSTHQPPPATTYTDVCGAPPEPAGNGGEEKKDRETSSSDAGTVGDEDERADASGPTASRESSPVARSGTSKDKDRGRSTKTRSRTRPKDNEVAGASSTSPAPEVPEAADVAAPADAESANSAPVAGLAGLGLTALLGAAGFVVRGRRRRDA